MANYNKPKTTNKNIGIIIVMSIFAIIGLACIIIGYGNEFLSWLKTFGIVICVLAFPVIVFIVYKMLIRRVKEM